MSGNALPPPASLEEGVARWIYVPPKICAEGDTFHLETCGKRGCYNTCAWTYRRWHEYKCRGLNCNKVICRPCRWGRQNIGPHCSNACAESHSCREWRKERIFVRESDVKVRGIGERKGKEEKGRQNLLSPLEIAIHAWLREPRILSALNMDGAPCATPSCHTVCVWEGYKRQKRCKTCKRPLCLDCHIHLLFDKTKWGERTQCPTCTQAEEEIENLFN